MQFKDLTAIGYKKVCMGIESKATGLSVHNDGIAIKRSGVTIYFMYEMLYQIIVEKGFVDFCMGTRPYCNIRVALKNMESWEQADLYRDVMGDKT
jgi:hypothetical protein